MSYVAKTDWKTGDSMQGSDLNKIEQGVADAHQTLDNLPNFNDFVLSSDLPDFDDFVRDSEIPDVSGFATKSEIPDISGLATKSELDQKVTAGQVQDMIDDIPPTDLTDYATKNYVTSAINEAVLAGGDIDIDLTPYALNTDLNNKVDKVTGKGLSSNDFTNTLKEKLDGLSNYNDSLIQSSLANKVDNVNGKELSTNDFTNTLKNKLDGIESGAQKNPDLSGYALKTEVNSIEIPVKVNGTTKTGMKIECFDVTVSNAGTWSLNISSAGFTEAPRVIGLAANQSGTDLAGRRSVGITTKTKDLITGYFMSGTAVGLIGNGLTEATGTFEISLMGK